MKEYIYDHEHAVRWAAFSGDYNPVHFCLTAAEEMNLPGLIAHGMRVLVDIKKHVFLQLDNTANNLPMPVRLLTRFEKPVLCGKKYILLDNTKKNKKKFSLVDPLTEHVHIRMSLSSSDYSEVWDSISKTQITRDYVASTLRNWPSEISADSVSFLSLVMFRELLCAPNILPKKIFKDHLTMGTIPELLLQQKVLQTHYELIFDTSLISKKNKCLDGVEIYTGKPSITGDHDHGWLIQVQVTAKEDEKTLLQNLLTLKVTPNVRRK